MADNGPTSMMNSLKPPGTRSLGASGIDVSALAWGMWRFRGADLASAGRLVRTALDGGISLLDTANVYGLDSGEPFGAAESLLGRVLEADAGLRRRFVLSGKGGISPGTPYDSSADHLLSACEASLRRLKTDTIDLYQVHRPDILTHPHEVAGALVKLRDSGKIRAAGVSNYTVSQTAALQAFLPFPLACHQPEFSALSIEPLTDGILDQAIERNMAVLAWSPLGGGRLCGAAADDRSRAVMTALDKVALREAAPRAAVALAWVMAHASKPTAIIGTQSPERMSEALRSLELRLTRADWYEILAASRQARLP
jgi:predicted oxidoreductase